MSIAIRRIVQLVVKVYKLSDNRKMGVVCAAFVTMVIFGAWHFTGDGCVEVLFRIQVEREFVGIGSEIFHAFGADAEWCGAS